MIRQGVAISGCYPNIGIPDFTGQPEPECNEMLAILIQEGLMVMQSPVTKYSQPLSQSPWQFMH
jgi:hypothetical protein